MGRLLLRNVSGFNSSSIQNLNRPLSGLYALKMERSFVLSLCCFFKIWKTWRFQLLDATKRNLCFTYQLAMFAPRMAWLRVQRVKNWFVYWKNAFVLLFKAPAVHVQPCKSGYFSATTLKSGALQTKGCVHRNVICVVHHVHPSAAAYSPIRLRHL